MLTLGGVRGPISKAPSYTTSSSVQTIMQFHSLLYQGALYIPPPLEQLRALPQCTAFEWKKKWYKDQTLTQLALRKKAAWGEWAANGRPDVGPLHDAKTKTRANFRKRMRICIATDERKRTLRFDQQFKGKHPNRFKLPSKKCQQGNTLLVNQKVTTDPNTVFDCLGEEYKCQE